jgi:hypothetical protein
MKTHLPHEAATVMPRTQIELLEEMTRFGEQVVRLLVKAGV